MIEATQKIWHNGSLIPWNEPRVHVLVHGLHCGSSMFEGIRCYETNQGPAIFRAREHVRRFFDSACTAAELTPIRSMDAMPIGKSVRGPVAQRLQQVFTNSVRGRNALSEEWLTFVKNPAGEKAGREQGAA